MTEIPARNSCSIPCNVCGARDVEEVSTRDRDGSYLRTVICRRCGLLWTDPRPTAREIQDYYAQAYRLDYKATYQPKACHLYRGGRVALERCAQLTRFLKPESRVLDFGAGAGEFVYVLRMWGYDAVGIEPNEGYSRFAAETLGVPVTQGFYQSAEVPAESCDAVTLFHVLEHLEDPSHAMRRVGSWLKPQGLLVVEVPNVEAVCQWPGHRFHRAHLYNFNPVTLRLLFEKADFLVRDTAVSSDGGTVTVVGEKAAKRNASAGVDAPGNYERVVAILRRHTNLRHLLSGYPLRRVFAKLAQRCSEYWRTRGRTPTPQILDDLLRRTSPCEKAAVKQ
jgi:SAM-dependent methyltransferase